VMSDRLSFGEGRHERSPRAAPVVAVAREGLTDQHGHRRLQIPGSSGVKAALPDRQCRDPIAREYDGVSLQGHLAHLF